MMIVRVGRTCLFLLLWCSAGVLDLFLQQDLEMLLMMTGSKRSLEAR